MEPKDDIRPFEIRSTDRTKPGSDSSLQIESTELTCSRLACAAKGAQPIDKFGVKWDGTRVQMCLSCSERHRACQTAYRHRQIAPNMSPESRISQSQISNRLQETSNSPLSYSAPTAVRHRSRDDPPRLPTGFDPFLNSIEPVKSLGYEDPPSPNVRKVNRSQILEPSQPTSVFDPFQNSIPLSPTRPSSDAPTIHSPPRLISRQPTYRSQLTSAFDLSLISSTNHLPTILPNKRRRLSSSANPAPPRPTKIRTHINTGLNAPAREAARAALHFLEDEFKLRETASEAFPPKISSSHIRTSIGKYAREMSTASKTSVCCSCGKLVPTTDVYEIGDEDNFVRPLQGYLDICGRHGNIWDFCSQCHSALSLGTIPKFSAKNLVNVIMCQHYPIALDDLTPVEECLIAKCHPIGTIIKLRPGGHLSPINYKALRGHIIVIPQDPGPLLQILPSPELRLDNLIKVIWFGNRAPADTDLKPFLQVRKDKVLTALEYLVQHNHLYHDLTINHQMMDTWSDDFIPPEIRDNIICLGSPDHHEREGYAVRLQVGNYENDLQAAQDEGFDADDNETLLTGSVYTDVNGERQDPNVRMIDALLGIVTGSRRQAEEGESTEEGVTDRHPHARRKIPVISYAIRGQATLANSWEDPHYFTAAFPTLFPNGVGGHLDQRTVPVSLVAFVEWALNHHSRRRDLPNLIQSSTDDCRFARHNTFMYLFYDRLQLRSSSVAHAMLVKRENWKSTSEDVASLTVDQLDHAARAVAEHRIIDDPTIRRLQRNIVTIGMQVPESFSQKLKMRSEIRGLIVRHGMPAFWMTINPSDLRNPLVLYLAGVEYSEDALPAATAALRRATATSNPVAVAQFFHHTCKGVFDGLLGSGGSRMGILGQVANHFGVVETNGRGMLHLHALVWVAGNLAFTTLRNRLLQDSCFAGRMIHYLEAVIMQSIDLDITDHSGPSATDMPPSTKSSETDDEFHVRLSTDSNAVACKKQMHSRNHNATCFKYGQKGLDKVPCRFGMPRDLVSASTVDELGVIHLARNHGWVNPWNPAIASCIRSNQDISWIPTVAKALSLIYYVTNYATKDDVSPYQMLLKAALLKRAIEKAKATLTPDAADLRIRQKDMDQFALRCFNSLSHDREISGVQIASSLLRLPNYYTHNYNFVQLNLWWLRRYVRGAIQPTPLPTSGTSDPMGEEQCTYQAGDRAPVSRFDNYKWRGPQLVHLSLFEYCMLVQTKNLRDAIAADVEYDPEHPKRGLCVQRLAHKKSLVMTVTFAGQLSEYQTEEESLRRDHPKTTAIANDLAEILLGLFVPWNQLLPLFQQHAAEYETKRDASAKVWNIVEPTLSSHNRNFARNIELLRKSREDGRIDAALRTSANQHNDSLDYDIDNVELIDPDSDGEEALIPVDEDFSAETLIAAYHSIAKSWNTERLIIAQRVPAVLPRTTRPQTMELDHLQPLDIFRLPTHATSGLRFIPTTTLQCWEKQVKGFAALSDADDSIAENRLAFEVDDFNFDLGDGILHPLLDGAESLPSPTDRRSQVGDNPTGSSLTLLVNEDVPLNGKQRLVVEKVLSGALAWADHAHDASKRDQMLLYVGGEGGVGKSQVIKGIVAGMDLISRKDEVILMAPTGAAADNISGNTYHTSLGISINKTQEAVMSSRVRRLWSNKTIMIIDEVSMMDLSMLSTVNRQCKIAKSLDRSSPDLFGGLPIVLLMGDFYQFSPVRGPALWQDPRQGNDEHANGRLIWHRFTNIIILDQQMRQAEDPIFHDMLTRARNATLTEDDLALLNSKTITSLLAPELEGATTVVKMNTLRHHINRIQMEHFARSRSQKIYIFPALHRRTKSTGHTNLRLRADDLLQQPDQGTKTPFPGLFLYTPEMPTVILTNVCTALGQVNGGRGIAVGVVVDPTAEFFEMDDLYILCTKPPACVLFKPHRSRRSKFDDLEASVMPVFPLEKSITLKGYSVRRRQVPMCPAFSLTDYKIQGSTLPTAILDLKNDPASKARDPHKKYCSIYVQLSRLQSLDGLHLLQKIEMRDLQFSPDHRLLAEMERLQGLQRETIAAWDTMA